MHVIPILDFKENLNRAFPGIARETETRVMSHSEHQFEHHVSAWFSTHWHFNHEWVLFPEFSLMSSFALGKPQISTDWNVFMCTKPQLWRINVFLAYTDYNLLITWIIVHSTVQTVLSLGFWNLIKTPPIHCTLVWLLHHILSSQQHLVKIQKYSNMICRVSIGKFRCLANWDS